MTKTSKNKVKAPESHPKQASLHHETLLALREPHAAQSSAQNLKTQKPLRKNLQKAGLHYKTKKRILLALILYSAFYGAFVINIIDLGLPVQGWFHIFLIIAYFCPSIILIIILGWRNWDIALAIGLLISLMNDLLYAPVGNLLAVTNYDLTKWYARQLGLHGLEPAWTFRAGIIFFRTTSLLIGASIYIRLIAVYILIAGWLKK